MKTVVLFGGTGFIGTHLAQHLLLSDLAETIYLVDLNQPRDLPYTAALQSGLRSGRVTYVAHDVRQPIPAGLLPCTVDLIFNLAAVHREPGPAAREYFETNLKGAENVCAWANEVGCDEIVFTSSIAPYGPCEEKTTEESLPVPETPYGSSKLAAEKIHLGWQSAGEDRRLLILRPGVVFGAGEGGNVTRLVKSVAKGYFVYLGNQKRVKAAGYVKELCRVAIFGLDTLRRECLPTLLLNFTMEPPPTMERLVDAMRKVMGRSRRPLSMPPMVLLGLTYPMIVVERLLGVKLPINAVRISKLTHSNNVWAEKLKSLGYESSYSLESALLDWKVDAPEDFSG